MIDMTGDLPLKDMVVTLPLLLCDRGRRLEGVLRHAERNSKGHLPGPYYFLALAIFLIVQIQRLCPPY
jgi:hypothetical protein